MLHLQVAKSVSLRLYNELEAVQKKNSHLEWENEVLREKTQELEVAKQVLQTELDKTREVSILHQRPFGKNFFKFNKECLKETSKDKGPAVFFRDCHLGKVLTWTMSV